MMILRIEFTTTTKFGTTHCQASKYIYDNYRDVANVEDAVKYIKQCFGNKAYSNQLVDFIYFNEHERLISRYFRFYGTEINYVYFGGMGNGISATREKFDSRDIKKAYLEACDKAIEWKEEAQRVAEGE